MPLIKEGKNYSIISKSRSRIPERFRDLPFKRMFEEILGKKAFVSAAFISQQKIKSLNKKYRGENRSTDNLSFPLESGGEILFSMKDVSLKAKSCKLKAVSYLSYLLIHALLHLKGLRHSSKMDRQEKKFCKLFGIKYPSFNESR